jgi:hypothetical protein
MAMLAHEGGMQMMQEDVSAMTDGVSVLLVTSLDHHHFNQVQWRHLVGS